MNTNEEAYGVFDRYLQGKMPLEERAGFEKKLVDNKPLREEFLWMQIAVSEIRMTGKTILKKQLAEIGAAIPSSAFEKYSPSIKQVSFIKKWWWCIAIVSVAIALVVAWFVLHQHPNNEKMNIGFPAKNDVQQTGDFDKAGVAPKGNLDSVFAVAKQFVDSAGNSKYPCLSFSVPILTRNGNVWFSEDTIMQTLAGAYSWNGKANILVECCQQNNINTYTLYPTCLTLNSTYADTSGLQFYEIGGGFIMTDKMPGYFLLLKTGKKAPLVRQKNTLRETMQKVITDTVGEQIRDREGK